MTRKTYSVVAGLLAAGAAAWWWRRRPSSTVAGESEGVVIFDNTPAASTADGDLTL